MRFLVDECAGPAVAKWLRGLGHDVFSVFDDDKGSTDDEILSKAFDEDRILITNDKDFGEMISRTPPTPRRCSSPACRRKISQ